MAIPWYCISDFLLSTLVVESGHQLYEMKTEIRQEALIQLNTIQGLGRKRERELSFFLLEYSEKKFGYQDPALLNFWDIQKLVALAYINPKKAIQYIAQSFLKSFEGKFQDFMRIHSIVTDLEEPLSRSSEEEVCRSLDALNQYSEIAALISSGQEEKAFKCLSDLPLKGKSIEIMGVTLPSPNALLKKYHYHKYTNKTKHYRKIASFQHQTKNQLFKNIDNIRTNYLETDVPAGSLQEEQVFKLSTAEYPFSPDSTIHKKTADVSREKQSSTDDKNNKINIPDDEVFEFYSLKNQDILSSKTIPKIGTGIVTDIIRGSEIGRVKYEGKSWRAKAPFQGSSLSFGVGEAVSIFARQGNILLVIPFGAEPPKALTSESSKSQPYFSNLIDSLQAFFQITRENLDEAKLVIFSDSPLGMVESEIAAESPGRIKFEDNVSWRAEIHKNSPDKILLKGEMAFVIGRRNNVLLVSSANILNDLKSS